MPVQDFVSNKKNLEKLLRQLQDYSHRECANSHENKMGIYSKNSSTTSVSREEQENRHQLTNFLPANNKSQSHSKQIGLLTNGGWTDVSEKLSLVPYNRAHNVVQETFSSNVTRADDYQNTPSIHENLDDSVSDKKIDLDNSQGSVISNLDDPQNIAEPSKKRDLEEFLSDVNEDNQKKIESIWEKRKLALEEEAKTRAKQVYRERKRKGLSLKQVIDESLREYVDMYENAHALRLQFESEKEDWTRSIQEKIREEMQEKTPPNIRFPPSVTPFASNIYDSKSQKDSWGSNPQLLTKAYSPVEDLNQRRNLSNEFQYFPEDTESMSEKVSHSATRVSMNIADLKDVTVTMSAGTRKKFHTPSK